MSSLSHKQETLASILNRDLKMNEKLMKMVSKTLFSGKCFKKKNPQAFLRE